MQEVLLREGMLLCDKSSRLLHQKSQLKTWRVMEMEKIIRNDMRLYTIGKISDEIVYFFFHWPYNFFIDCIHIFFKQKNRLQLLCTLFSLIKMLFLLHFLEKLFLYIESIGRQIINKFYVFYFHLPGRFLFYSLSSAKISLANRSSCPVISCSWAATRLASMTASLNCWAFLWSISVTKEKNLICFHLQHTIKFIWRFTKLVSSNDLFSWSSQYSK